MNRLLQRITWRLRATLAPRPRILTYHRVMSVPGSDAFSMYVAPADFSEHLRLLRDRYRPLAMTHFFQVWRSGSVPRNAVVVTFDDGYADNLSNALPLLEQFEIPAMFFITAAYVGGEKEFWWDALERILHADMDMARLIRATLKLADPGAADDVLQACRDRLLAMPAIERDELLAQWHSAAGLPDSSRHSYRVLDIGQLVTLAQHPLVEIGAHGITHCSLPHLSSAAQYEEISGSRTMLEEYLGRRVRYFAYPFGAFDAASESAVQRAGFDGAFTTEWAPVRRRSSPWRMPRLTMSGAADRLARCLAHTA